MDDTPIPPEVSGPNTPRNVGLRIWRWSQVHTVAAGTICGLVVGFVLGKLL